MTKVDALSFINPATLYDPRPHAYSHLAQFPADWRVIMPAGQVAGTIDSHGFDPDFRKQFQEALENVRLVLEPAGATLKDVAKFVVYIVDYDQDKFSIYREEMTRVWGDRCPAGTLVPVPALALPSILVEIDVVAAVPNG